MKKLFTALMMVGIAMSLGYAQKPLATQITTNPVQYEKSVFDIQIADTFSNPYKSERIALDMVISAPSGKKLILPCFYYSGSSGASLWKAYFAPVESGTYSGYFLVTINNASKDSSDNLSFTVAPSAKNGFILMNNSWSFKYSSGKLFRGIGENVAWEARSWEDQKFKYEYILPRLSKNGANFFRMWMCPWNVPVEWKKVKDTKFYTNSNEYFNPSGIKRFDKLVDLCDSLDMHFMIAIDAHGALKTTGEWSMHNYNKVNGGPCTKPADFFSMPAAKQMYKNKLRYLVARWGYSPAVGVWEFFNELDNAVYDESIPQDIVTSWHDEMSKYLKSIDPYDHPISTSLSHRTIGNLYNVSGLDFNQIHIYKATSTIPSKVNTETATYKKPFVVGEFGFEWDWNVNFSTIEPQMLHDYRIGLWYGLMNQTPILPMSWWWEWFDARNSQTYFASVREISNRIFEAGGDSIQKVNTSYVSDHFAVKAGHQYFIYLHNQTSNALVDKSLSVPVVLTGSYSVKVFNPDNRSWSSIGNILPVDGKLTVPELTLQKWEERIVVLTPVDITIKESKPFKGTPFEIPGKFEAEDFDEGISGISWNDVDTINSLKYYRSNTGADIDSISNGYAVGDLNEGEWLNYSITIKTSGSYMLEVPIKAQNPGKGFHIDLNGKEIIGLVQIGTEDTLKIPIDLIEKGDYLMKVSFDGSGFSIDNFKFSLNNQQPQAKILIPFSDSTITQETMPAQVKIGIDANDNDGTITKVELYNGTKLLGTSTEAPYNFDVTLESGVATIYAKVYDSLKMAGVSEKRFITIKKGIPTGIKTKNNSVSIYPNPVKDIINISGVTELAKIAIYDLSGRLQMSLNGSTNYNLSNLQDGFYQIQIFDANGKEVLKTKFVKIKK